ncbi:hypothetical protein I6H44_05125 [Aggregatibacter segnis]|jgi:hypothetical protein|uniref:Uncharacterized protein n=1 Tax=Aggregatibacter segnis ATCC 33393 TaxID=888057 RepID=E6KZU0_9PAST|nr:conserved hypothetical protein [Aggregatibacter segnis ATCC 33393]QQB08674.1 hypothetical protein I6H44_05125 [Aggregatibacter segnis]
MNIKKAAYFSVFFGQIVEEIGKFFDRFSQFFKELISSFLLGKNKARIKRAFTFLNID